VNANFLWLTGIPSEIETPEARYSLLLMASEGALDVPASLPFPTDGKASLIIAGGNPTEEQLEPIDRLLDLYNRDKVLLRAAYERRKQEAEQREAALRPIRQRRKT
jgi:hypothetical protein